MVRGVRLLEKHSGRRIRFSPFGFSGLAMVLALVLGSAATAQDTNADPWGTLGQLKVGDSIQVVRTTLQSQNGIFQNLSDAAVFFRVGREERSVSRENLLRLTVMDRSRRKRNAVLGVALGAAAGMAGGGALAAAAGWFDEGTGARPAVTIVGFGAGGAVAGYALGASSGTRTLYRKRDPTDK